MSASKPSDKRNEASSSSLDIEFSALNSGYSSVDSFPISEEKSSFYKNNFQQECLLGKGGFGYVTKVTSKIDEHSYAVKIVPVGTKDKINEQQIREARSLASLSHPNVVRYHTSWIEEDFQLAHIKAEDSSESSEEVNPLSQDDSSKPDLQRCLFIQMELCRYSLRSLLDERFRKDTPYVMDAGKIIRNFCYIVDGLTHIHSLGFLHRDLSTNNILVDSAGVLKIGDFGLARSISSDEEMINAPLSRDVGTLLYRAPEILTNNYDHTVDYYSLGMILFEMVYPMNTVSEKYKILTNLRNANVPFPDNFLDCGGSSLLERIIKSFLDHSSKERMLPQRSVELLSSAENCSSIVGPNQGELSSSQEGTPDYNYSDSSGINSVVKYIEKKFKNHGASLSLVPLMQHENLLAARSRIERSDIERFLVKNKNQNIIRYSTCNVLEAAVCNLVFFSSGQDSTPADAKALAVLLDIFKGFSTGETATLIAIAISHTDIVKAILLSVGVEHNRLASALELVGTNGYKGLRQLKGINSKKLESILSISGKPENIANQLVVHLGTHCSDVVKRVVQILEYCQNIIGMHTLRVTMGLKWCSNVHNYCGVLFTVYAYAYENGQERQIILADGGRYFFKSRRDLTEDKYEENGALNSACGMSVYPYKMLKVQKEFNFCDLVVLACCPGSNKENLVFALGHKLRAAGFKCREDLNIKACDVKDKSILCLVEFIQDDLVKVTHKNVYALHGNKRNSVQYEIKLRVNPDPPSIFIEQDSVLKNLKKIRYKLQKDGKGLLSSSSDRRTGFRETAPSPADLSPPTRGLARLMLQEHEADVELRPQAEPRVSTGTNRRTWPLGENPPPSPVSLPGHDQHHHAQAAPGRTSAKGNGARRRQPLQTLANAPSWPCPPRPRRASKPVDAVAAASPRCGVGGGAQVGSGGGPPAHNTPRAVTLGRFLSLDATGKPAASMGAPAPSGRGRGGIGADQCSSLRTTN